MTEVQRMAQLGFKPYPYFDNADQNSYSEELSGARYQHPEKNIVLETAADGKHRLAVRWTADCSNFEPLNLDGHKNGSYTPFDSWEEAARAALKQWA